MYVNDYLNIAILIIFILNMCVILEKVRLCVFKKRAKFKSIQKFQDKGFQKIITQSRLPARKPITNHSKIQIFGYYKELLTLQ